MKTIKAILSLFLTVATIQMYAQSERQANNFDTEGTLEIMIDSTSADTIWQIGIPQKSVLNETSSQPNALMTDTLNTYPVNTNASFTVEMSEFTMEFFPYIQLEWFYKTDFEDAVDGGIIEVSYDLGQTWSNIFTDTIYRPEVVGTYQYDTLHNQVAGMTGTSELSWMAICWGTAIGSPPADIENVQVRFTMTTDSVDSQHDGWLIDNFNVGLLVIGSTANRVNFKNMTVYPNPALNEIELNIAEIINEDVDVYIYDNAGQIIYSEKAAMYGEVKHKVNVSNFPKGIYYVIVSGEEVHYRQKFIKLN